VIYYRIAAISTLSASGCAITNCDCATAPTPAVNQALTAIPPAFTLIELILKYQIIRKLLNFPGSGL